MKLQSLKDVKRVLKVVENKKKKKRCKENFLFNKMNKDYKNIDWNTSKIDNVTARKIFKNNVYINTIHLYLQQNYFKTA